MCTLRHIKGHPSCDTSQRSPFQGLQIPGSLWHNAQLLPEVAFCSSCLSNHSFCLTRVTSLAENPKILNGQQTSQGKCSGSSLVAEVFLFCINNALLS
jgi:hypothetical protein